MRRIRYSVAMSLDALLAMNAASAASLSKGPRTHGRVRQLTVEGSFFFNEVAYRSTASRAAVPARRPARREGCTVFGALFLGIVGRLRVRRLRR